MILKKNSDQTLSPTSVMTQNQEIKAGPNNKKPENNFSAQKEQKVDNDCNVSFCDDEPF